MKLRCEAMITAVTRIRWQAVVFGLVVIQLLAAATQAEPLRFATMDMEPYGFAHPSETRPGLITEIHAVIAARASLDYSDSVTPFKRMVKQILRGQSDCGTFMRTDWSHSNFELVAEIHEGFESVIVTRAGIDISHMEDLYGHLLALPRGTYVGSPVSDDPEIRRHRTNGYAQSARIFKAGRVDAIAGSAISLFYNLALVGMGRDDFGGVFVFDRRPLWLHCAKGKLSEPTLARLRIAANALRREGIFDHIITSYR